MSDLVEVKMTKLPQCNFCNKQANYDFATKNGQWAYGCEEDYQKHRAWPTLGTGKGQRLVLKQPTTHTPGLTVGDVLKNK